MVERVGIEVFVDPRGTKAGVTVAKKSLSSLERQATKTEQEFKSLSAGASKLGVALGSIVSVAALGSLAKGIIDVDAKFQKLEASLETVTGSSLAAQAAFAQITDFAKQTPFSLEQVVESFIKLKALGLDPSERALTSYGNTASAMGKSLNQLIEAVADASTNEFERLKDFGITAKQQGDSVAFTFREVTTTVKKNSEEIQAYLLNIGETDFAGGSQRQMETLGSAITNLGDEWQKLQKRISDTGFGDAAEGQIRGLTAAIESVDSKAIDDFADSATLAAKAAATLLVARKIGPIFGANSAEIRANSASLAANALAATKASIQTNAYGQVIARTTVLTRASTLATRAASASMALLGGPAGVAILGAYAVYELASAMNETEDKTRQAKEEVDGFISNLQELNDLQKQTTLTTLNTDVSVNLREQARLQAEINSLSGRGGFSKKNKLQEQLNELKREELILSEKQQALFNNRLPKFTSGSKTSGSNIDPKGNTGGGDSSDFEKLQKSLKKEIALYGESGRAAELSYQLKNNALGEFSAEQKNTLQGLAGEIASLEAEEDAQRQQEKLDRLIESLYTEEEAVLASYERRRQQIVESSANPDQKADLLQRNDEDFEQQVLGPDDAPTTFEDKQAALKEEYQRKRELILAEEKITGESKQALRLKLESDLQAKLKKLDDDNAKAKLSATADLFGNLSSLSSAFGGQQSKAGKAFAIAQATINTYLAAQNAYSAMSAIPIVGPALGIAAAAAAVASGLANVSAIKSASVSGVAHGGMDYIPKESTFLLDEGERVLSPNQNKDLTQFLRNSAGPQLSVVPQKRNNPQGAQQAGNGGGNITIINTGSPTQVISDSGVSDRDRQIIIGEAVDQSRQAIASDAARGGNDVSDALESTYGLDRAVGARR